MCYTLIHKICKPLIPIELKFYQLIHNHPQLLPFTAAFYGTVDLTLTKQEVTGFMNKVDQLAEKPQPEDKEVMNPWSAKVCKAQFNSLLPNEASTRSIQHANHL